jgi:Spy/CpxP family protein refolding chaperone
MARELGLSEAQTAKLKAIHTAHREAAETLHAALREAEKAVMDAVRAGGDLRAVHAVFAQAHLAAMTEAKAVHGELLAVLTPEQQARAKALHAQHPEGRGPGHGPGRGRPGSGDPSLPPPPRPFGEAE